MKLEGCIRKQPLADRRVGCALYNEVILPRIELQTYIYIYTHACLHRLYLDEPASFGGSCAACATTIFFFFLFFLLMDSLRWKSPLVSSREFFWRNCRFSFFLFFFFFLNRVRSFFIVRDEILGIGDALSSEGV